jgi:hypothetical protein
MEMLDAMVLTGPALEGDEKPDSAAAFFGVKSARIGNVKLVVFEFPFVVAWWRQPANVNPDIELQSLSLKRGYDARDKNQA